jgi:CRISPR-associated endonuclease/helicase Cas3
VTDALAHIWAKSAAVPEEQGELLSLHTGWVLEELHLWRRRLANLATYSRADIWDVAAWACLLHDTGKVAAGFQRMLRPDGRTFDHRHEVLSLVTVGWLDVSDDVRALVAAGVATHHKDWNQIWALYSDIGERNRLLAEMSVEDERALRRWLSGEGAPNMEECGFARLPGLRDISAAEAMQHAFRCLRHLTEILEEENAVSRPNLAARASRGLILLADHAGSAHERLREPPALADAGAFRRAVPFLQDELPHHQDIAARSVGHCLLTAPTGSGKTEAALLWAAHQRATSGTPRTIFYVLPYRSSLNAMHARMQNKYGLHDNEVVLQHSSATTALYRRLLDEKTYTSKQAESTARRNRALGKLMTAPVRILTPYQLLRGFFGLKGHEAILTDATEGVFILDELHAYDAERLALLLAAVEHLAKDLGASFMAMSATFPDVLCTLLADAVGPVSLIEADQRTKDLARRHVLHLVDRDLLAAETVNEITRRFASGEAVLVVTTTVARAQEIYDLLKTRVPEGTISLLHGRFTGDDRATKEVHLMRRVANGRHRGDASGTILVATQVVEVSLDVDFDVLFSDPAPIEPLVQRFGRVNRARRPRLSDVIVHTSIPDASSHIYASATVESALKALRPCAGSPIDEDMVQAWVDAAYEPVRRQFIAHIRRMMREYRTSVIEANRPLESHDDLRSMFDKQFDGSEVVPMSLREEYERRQEEEPLLAPGLCVPISQGQWFKLRSSQRLVDSVFADCPYDSDRGLDLSFRTNDDA